MVAKVLIVDDEPKILEMMKIFLENEGYRVSVCPNGPSALEAVKKQVPDLILLDIRLQGIDGWEVHESLRASQSTRDVPIIMITAKADESLESPRNGDGNGKKNGKRSGHCGPTDIIYKPFSPDVLLEKVRSALGG